MKKAGLLSLILALIVAFSISAGCSSKQTAKGDKEGGKININTGDSKVSLDGANKRINVEAKGEEGTVKATIDATDDSGRVEATIDGPDGTSKVVVDQKTGSINVEGLDNITKLAGDDTIVRVSNEDGDTEVKTSTSVKESDFPVKFYPGARIIDGSSVDTNIPGVEAISSRYVELSTKDGVAKVAEFYKTQLPNSIVNTSDDEVTIVSTPDTADGSIISISIEKDDETGETEITITCQKS